MPDTPPDSSHARNGEAAPGLPRPVRQPTPSAAGPGLAHAGASRRRLRILTWHVHGNYLYYLSQLPHDIAVVVRPGNPPGYAAPGDALPWGGNVHTVAGDALAHERFDCILFQSRVHYDRDQYELLTPEQRKLPRIYLEHDPPQEHPTNQCHWFQEPDGILVHVTPFNALMWDSGITPVQVVEHGVIVPDDVRYTGEKDRGIVVVNHLERRGRRLGADIYARVRRDVALDLVGMDAQASGGLGEIANLALPGFMAGYRYFFNPIRYTSLGLAVIEAMHVGLPIVGLATTELATVVRNHETGYVDTDVARLVQVMRQLAADRELAAEWGANARRHARERFGIERFVADWQAVLDAATHGTSLAQPDLAHATSAPPRQDLPTRRQA
ncbi:glycosyltransferase family 4 protein [Verticiella sediminum]|uniref:Glycosyltransferase family 4 protein n=1 Tax=Verticiella sediminum TaxID=1247510 RepID=A0A556AF51_9BURK|nr:glycosyltransferase family 4 protein [Verticiella sediminum]TSH91510.1 glycosyltransferase family 4 protein [Verticiella sediminum]